MPAAKTITLHVNGVTRRLNLDPETPLLYALRQDLGLKGAKYGCGVEQCGACMVLIAGAAVPSCRLPLAHAAGLEITTVEGLAAGDARHPLQEAFLEEQAAQCGFCTAGMIVAAQGLLNRRRYPSDADIREALAGNLCRCGVYDRVRRAIKLRTGRLEAPKTHIIDGAPLPDEAPATAETPSLDAYPNIDDWLQFNADRSVTVFSGKVELGQGISTALAQLAADALGLNAERILMVHADTARSPDEGGTTGSRSLETSGVAIQQAALSARRHLLALAFEHIHARSPITELTVDDGTITDPISGRSVDYWALMAGKRFNAAISRERHHNPARYQNAIRRRDLPRKVSGGAFLHDMELPGMLHARVLRPPAYKARLTAFDRDAIEALPGLVAVVKDGQFIAIAATREEQAIAALERARAAASWEFTAALPAAAEIYRDLRAKPALSQRIVDGVAAAGPPPAQPPRAEGARRLSASYKRPFQMHGSLGPAAALALWQDGKLTVWSHSQAAFSLRGALAQVLSLEPAQVRVIHCEGAGCYGHNGADDAALDAALVARALPGTPILLKWTRWDEHAWEPYGSAMLLELGASLSPAGDIVDWNHEVWSYSHSTRPAPGLPTSGLLAAWHLERAFAPQQPRAMSGYHAGAHRNADPIYHFPRKRIVRHAVAEPPLRVSALRSLGAFANVFAIESFMDELAHAVSADPLDFRLRHLRDARARAVLLAAAERANWRARASQKAADEGWGLALAQYKNLQCYCAIVVKLHVNRESGEIQLRHAVIAADAGEVVNPDGLSNQLEGGFAQAASWTLYEAVSFDRQRITSVDWESYPILPFSAAPSIETVLVNRPGLPFLGAGEAAQNPTAAAIANAVYAAASLRLREMPFRPEKLRLLFRTEIDTG